MEPTTEKISPEERNRKCLHLLQPSAINKEILVGCGRISKSNEESETLRRKSDASEKKESSLKTKKATYQDKTTQIKPKDILQIEAKDLTSGNPSESYWEMLAETRLKQVERLMDENKDLKNRVNKLQEDIWLCKQMSDDDDTKELVEVLLKRVMEEDDNE